MQALFTSAVVWPAMVFYAVLELHIGKVRMKNRLGFIKTTLAGGIVFLIPAVSEAAPDIALGQKVGTAQRV
jgi:hypothetical protein